MFQANKNIFLLDTNDIRIGKAKEQAANENYELIVIRTMDELEAIMGEEKLDLKGYIVLGDIANELESNDWIDHMEIVERINAYSKSRSVKMPRICILSRCKAVLKKDWDVVKELREWQKYDDSHNIRKKDWSYK